MKKAFAFVVPLLFAALLAIGAVLSRDAAKARELDLSHFVIASWNVENLFDADDDPGNEGDDDYTPGKWTLWTHERYRMKLTNLTEVISEMAPDILVMTEVENRRVLDDLCEVLKHVRGYPMEHIIHKDSTDFRGIDVAILSRVKPTRVSWIDPGKGLRYSPVAEFSVRGKKLVVIGDHWKSRYVAKGSSKEQCDRTRALMAEHVRDAYRHHLRKDPNAAILVMGDFNDNLDDPAPAVAGFSLDQGEVLRGGTNLFCLSSLLPATPKGRGTFYYSRNDDWNSFDTINVSRGLLTTDPAHASDWLVLTNSYEIFATPKQRFGDRFPDKKEPDAPYPCRRGGKLCRFFNGYSDHFPVRVVLKAR